MTLRPWPDFGQGTASLLFLLLLMTGCAGPSLQFQNIPPVPNGQPSRVELTETPFFPQEAYQCGPAALATVLRSSGVSEADPERLAEQVYLPGRFGSLQTELLAATRRAERVPYPLEPRVEALMTEVRSGHPVLVMQNLGLSFWPQWHYAVVIGFDREAEKVILRSGTTRREVLSFRHFERTWHLADYWALVVAPQGTTPATAEANPYLAAVAALEQQNRWPGARAGYQAARERWPENPNSRMGLGNIAYQQGDFSSAEAHYREAIEVAPEAPAGHYNLAWALLRQGEKQAAMDSGDEARRLAPEHPRYGQSLQALREASEG